MMNRGVLRIAMVLLACAPSVAAQTETTASASPALPAPKMLLLVWQEFKFGQAGARQKLEVASARAYDRLNVPVTWIELQSITGAPGALFFDPLDSYEDLDKDFAMFGQLFGAHPEIAKLQEDIEALVSSERTVVAVRRDDLGYRVGDIDISKARYLRVLEVRLHPGHESEFVDAFKTLGAAYEKLDADMPWVVYQASVGMPTPAFLIFVPMRALKENDDLLARGPSLRGAEGEAVFRETQRIAREAYASTESNLYEISAEMSHVTKEIAAGDPAFWTSKPATNATTSKPKAATAPAVKQR
jgi:hypothetical protein